MAGEIPEELRGRYPDAQSGLERYVRLLASDGIDRGLLGPREVGRLWDRHVANSLALFDLIPSGASVVDVGSGAGLPGLPLALVRPDLEVTLLEPLLRRSTFLTETVQVLDLGVRVMVVRQRAEDHHRTYDAVLARAVAPLDRLLTWCAPLRKADGVLLAIKGQSAPAEVDAARPQLLRRRLTAEILTVRAYPTAEPATVVRVRAA